MNRPRNQEAITGVSRLHKFREGFYLLLSRAFLKEADGAFLRDVSNFLISLQHCSELTEISRDGDIRQGKALLANLVDGETQEQDTFLQDLARDYASLFLGVGRKTVPICESFYRSRNGLLFQEPYFEVKRRYQEIGQAGDADFTEPADHLSVELGHMGNLCRLMVEAIEKSSEGVSFYLRSQKGFLTTHLRAWVPEFCTRLIETRRPTFYIGMTYLLRGYILGDERLLDAIGGIRGHNGEAFHGCEEAGFSKGGGEHPPE